MTILVHEGIEFHPVKDWEGYYVSRCGQVLTTRHKWKSMQVPRIRKQTLNPHGYLCVTLKMPERKLKFARVHRLVAETFIPQTADCVNHINGIQTDNRVENLEWCTNGENLRHHFRTLMRNTGPNHWNTKLTMEQVREAKRLQDDGHSLRAIGRIFGVSHATIKLAITNPAWERVAS